MHNDLENEMPTPMNVHPRPDRLLLVFDGDSGLAAMLLDVVKKAVGREDCPLCEIVYSPVGTRGSWRECEQRLGTPIEEWHRNRIPSTWSLSPLDLPCVLGCVGDELPFVLVTRAQIVVCGGGVDALEQTLRVALLSAAQVPAPV
jgi:hypothetical protein